MCETRQTLTHVSSSNTILVKKYEVKKKMKELFLNDLEAECRSHEAEFKIERDFLSKWLQLFTLLVEQMPEQGTITCHFGQSHDYPLSFSSCDYLSYATKKMPFREEDPKYNMIFAPAMEEGEPVMTDLRYDQYYFLLLKGQFSRQAQRIAYIPYRLLPREAYHDDFSYAYHHFINEYNFIYGFLTRTPLKRFKLMKNSAVHQLLKELS